MRLHSLLGEMVDTLCFILILTVSLFLFSYYWSDACQMEYAEYVTEGFLHEAERLQVISAENYRSFVERIVMLNGGFEVSMQLKRGKLVLYDKDIRTKFFEQEEIVLLEGDFITVTISKGQRKRTVLFAVIWG